MRFGNGFQPRSHWPAALFALTALSAALFTGCSGAAGNNPGPADTTPPSVSVSTPQSGATVSGSVTVSANASDNVGVAGVQFLLDGGNLGTEVTSPPFSTSWNTTQSSNAAHTLSARARDAAGNTATSAMVTVTVTNTLSPLQLDLVNVATGLTHPLDLQAPADGTGRLFVAEQGGKIKIIQNGQVLATAFLDIGAKLSNSAGEEGLLGLAFHPQYATNRRFFVNYTSFAGGALHTVIAEYKASAADANVADPAEKILLTVNQPETNHNGGGLAFGYDGNQRFLYIALGDGGGGGDVHGTIGNGQDTNTLLGKILRIDVDSVPAPGLQYAIPSSNPFVNQAGLDEIWLYGLRNPFRFSFDQPTRNLWIGDVGQGAFEEVDLLTPLQGGANLGWRCREGTHTFNFTANCQTATLIDPIFDYPHANSDATVIGGYVYHGTLIPQLANTYVFGDFISGHIWTLTQDAQSQWVRTQVLTAGAGNLSAFGQGQNGELYTAGYSSGVISHIHQVGTP